MHSDRLLYVLSLLPMAMLETAFMTFASAFFACLLGFPLGVFLHVASPAGLAPLRVPYSVASQVANLFRSIPFIILMILLIPLSRAIVGTSIGPVAAIVPLSIAAAPFVARVTEAALGEVDAGVITAAKAMGSTRLQIVRKVLIREAMPALVSGLALTVINLIAYSAMAGAIGGRGLGDLAIRYGLHRFELDVMIGTVIAILVLVQAVQLAGTLASRALLSKR